MMTASLHFQTLPLAQPPSISLEFFPPKTEALSDQLWESIQRLGKLKPKFVSVTYGAGGSTRDRTHALVKRIRQETPLVPAAHLTCVNASRDEIRRIAETYWEDGIRHIVALRGDAPEEDGVYRPHPQGYAYADDLVAGLRAIGDFEITVAAYPEMHPQARSMDDDIMHLKRKLDAGAGQAITQYFFDVTAYQEFMTRANAAGITKPIHPGILPVGNYKQMVRFSAMCGASVPSWMHARFEQHAHEPLAPMLAVATAAEQCKLLCAQGAQHLHFYTLNRPELVEAICIMLGIFPEENAA